MDPPRRCQVRGLLLAEWCPLASAPLGHVGAQRVGHRAVSSRGPGAEAPRGRLVSGPAFIKRETRARIREGPFSVTVAFSSTSTRRLFVRSFVRSLLLSFVHQIPLSPTPRAALSKRCITKQGSTKTTPGPRGASGSDGRGVGPGTPGHGSTRAPPGRTGWPRDRATAGAPAAVSAGENGKVQPSPWRPHNQSEPDRGGGRRPRRAARSPHAYLGLRPAASADAERALPARASPPPPSSGFTHGFRGTGRA